MRSHIIAMETRMVSLLSIQLLLTVNVYFAMSHMWHLTALHISHPSQHSMSHTLQHISPLTALHMYHTSHATPAPSTAPFHLPLQSLKRLREREDTSSLWHRYPTLLHLVEGMSLRPSSDHMGWNLSSSISPSCLVRNNFIHLSPVNIVLMRCWDVLTLYI